MKFTKFALFAPLLCAAFAIATCTGTKSSDGRPDRANPPAEPAKAQEATPTATAARGEPESGQRVAIDTSGKAPVVIDLGAKTLNETDEYKLELELPEKASAGKEGAVVVRLTPKKGWKLNKEFPTKLLVNPPEGVTVAKKSQAVGDAEKFEEKAGASWKVAFTAGAAGKKEFTGEFRFAVCTESTCDPKKEALAFSVDVK